MFMWFVGALDKSDHCGCSTAKLKHLRSQRTPQGTLPTAKLEMRNAGVLQRVFCKGGIGRQTKLCEGSF